MLEDVHTAPVNLTVQLVKKTPASYFPEKNYFSIPNKFTGQGLRHHLRPPQVPLAAPGLLRRLQEEQEGPRGRGPEPGRRMVNYISQKNKIRDFECRIEHLF